MPHPESTKFCIPFPTCILRCIRKINDEDDGAGLADYAANMALLSSLRWRHESEGQGGPEGVVFWGTDQNTVSTPGPKQHHVPYFFPPGLQRCGRVMIYIWYDDGSVVIQTERTQFRVHRSVLTSNSPVLKDMLENQTKGEYFVDGCPVVHLLDTPHDMSHFLKALYNRWYFRTRVLQPITVIAALVRLSGKYQVDYLHEEAVSCLMTEFPATLKQWDALPEGWVTIEDTPGVIIDIINLARECNILSIFPAAFLYLVQTGATKDILFGVERNDGSTALLSPENQRVCLLGLEKLRLGQAKHRFRWLDDGSVPSPECASPAECTEIKVDWVFDIWKPPGRVILVELDPIGFCETCAKVIGQIESEGRQFDWDSLLSYLELPEWKDTMP